jgi:uncharacterized protein (TIGR02598 family)
MRRHQESGTGFPAREPAQTQAGKPVSHFRTPRDRNGWGRALRGKFAFSLVEVVIAIGLVSFALLALVGLLTVGLKSSRESGEDTILAVCTGTTQALVRAEGFSNVSANPAYADTTPDFFFDSAGALLTDSAGAPLKTQNTNALYGCLVTRGAPALSQATTNLLVYQLKFVWPLAAPAANRQQRVVPASLANYE